MDLTIILHMEVLRLIANLYYLQVFSLEQCLNWQQEMLLEVKATKMLMTQSSANLPIKL